MIVYVGPTIYGIATRNTVYAAIPESLNAAFSEYPFLRDLCVPVSGLSAALQQIRDHDGAIYTFYLKASAIAQ